MNRNAHSKLSPTGTPSAVVVLDPTSDQGEGALDGIGLHDRHFAIMVLMSGPHSQALVEFANAEDTDLATAAWTYLEQVERRLGHRSVELIVATGPDTAMEAAHFAAAYGNARVLLPASITAHDRTVAERIQRVSGVEVVTIAPATKVA